jgi:hypothetical protein
MRYAKIASFIALGVASVCVSQAQVILVAGSDVGRFNANSFTILPNDTQTLLGLTFRGSTFSDTTAAGFVAFGAQPLNPNFNNFGSFALTTAANSYAGNTFTLRLMFTNPAVTNGDFMADILGTVSNTGGGGVSVDFGGPQTFNWSGGTFTVEVDDTNINPGFAAPITGNVRVVPEPASMAVMAIGAIGLLVRRRRKSL